MTTHLPLADVAPPATIEVSSAIPSSSFSSTAAASSAQGRSTAVPVATLRSNVVKLEVSSPTPSALTSADAETLAGRKHKLNCTSARGLANLTPEQLAKKRARDRQAQRAIREKTKAHINLLERRVRELSSQKPFLDLQAVLRQNEIIQAENREIRQGLKAIMDILQPLLGKHKLNSLPSTPSTTATHIPSVRSTPPLSDSLCFSGFSANSQRTAAGEQPYTESAASTEASSSTAQAAFTSSTARHDITTSGPAYFRIAFDDQRHNLAHGLASGGTDERMGFNFLLDASQQVPKVEGL
ncbi:hypothetical protein AnigIFM49718_011346 [Aspergillus niger]|nr:hypothetical protein AnigIFM49718_011346 [Aspergillus niger]GLA21319.1 hypothetical protein AnigIFM62618_010626 [Aspergillus niger]